MTAEAVAATKMGPTVSVIVCVKSDLRIHRLIESLVNQTVPKEQYEIIVVENGSYVLGDLSEKYKPTVRYIQTSTANRAVARNLGLRAARGRFLLMIDADCVASPDWIERLSERLAAGSSGAVGGAIRKYLPHSFTQRYGITVANGQLELSYLPALPLPYVASANAGYITASLLSIGGFDEAFESGEDVDICYRLGIQGHAIDVAPKAIVWHEDRESVVDHFRRFRHYAIYQVLLFAKYKQLSGRKYVLNPYPFLRLFGAFRVAPDAFVKGLRGDWASAASAFLQLVEAAGVWSGDISGSIRYRQIYL